MFSIAKLWNSLNVKEKLDLLDSIQISAENVDISDFNDQYPSFQSALLRKKAEIKLWRKTYKNPRAERVALQDQMVLKTGIYKL